MPLESLLKGEGGGDFEENLRSLPSHMAWFAHSGPQANLSLGSSLQGRSADSPSAHTGPAPEEHTGFSAVAFFLVFVLLGVFSLGGWAAYRFWKKWKKRQVPRRDPDIELDESAQPFRDEESEGEQESALF